MSGVRSAYIAASAILTILTTEAGAQTAELPVPCVAGVCGANIPGFVTSGRANATITNNVLRVQQQTDRAILNWASFNVGADGRVIFDQPGANSIALNRIFQGSPSRILGAIESNGQIFLINQNGFMFGPTARVRTAGLMVSSLDMLNSTFENGLLSPDLLRDQQPALDSTIHAGVRDPQGNPVLGEDGLPLEVHITIEQGARISTVGSGGRVMIAGQNVDNAGTIDTPDGQVILAAGEKVYLQASSDPALRGLLVEVNAGGEAWNRMTGEVSAARGNVTMVGLAVNQQGRVSATTSVSANGSIRLLARDTVTVEGNGSEARFVATHGGRLELGAEQPDHGHARARGSHDRDRRAGADAVEHRAHGTPGVLCVVAPRCVPRAATFACAQSTIRMRSRRRTIPRRVCASKAARCSMPPAATRPRRCRATWCAWSFAATSWPTRHCSATAYCAARRSTSTHVSVRRLPMQVAPSPASDAPSTSALRPAATSWWSPRVMSS